MITIRYSQSGPDINAWKEKLESLVVAYRFHQQEGLDEPVLTENGRSVRGTEAIGAYLKKLEADIDDWRTPRCGV